MYGSSDFDTDLPPDGGRWHGSPRPRRRGSPAPRAGYHPVTGWKVLGAVVEAVDGRPIETYLRDEILAPLGADGRRRWASHSNGRRSSATASCRWRGRGTDSPWWRTTARCAWCPYRIDELHNEPWHIAKVGAGRVDARSGA